MVKAGAGHKFHHWGGGRLSASSQRGTSPEDLMCAAYVRGKCGGSSGAEGAERGDADGGKRLSDVPQSTRSRGDLAKLGTF